MRNLYHKPDIIHSVSPRHWYRTVATSLKSRIRCTKWPSLHRCLMFLRLSFLRTIPRSMPPKKKISTAKLILALLQYFVTPPYLRNTVFNEKFRPYLTAASKLPRLSTLPFTRYQKQDHGRYREGLTIKMQKPTLARKRLVRYSSKPNILI